MKSRLKNAWEYTIKSAVFFAKSSSIAAMSTLSINGYFQFSQYKLQEIEEFCRTTDINRELSNNSFLYHHSDVDSQILSRINRDAFLKTIKNLNVYWPLAIISTSIACGAIGGAAYGYFFSDNNFDFMNIKIDPNEQEIYIDHAPEDFKDPVFFHIMQNPYTIKCGGNHTLDLSTLKKIVEATCTCPLCRREITGAESNIGLKIQITAYLNKNKLYEAVDSESEIINADNEPIDIDSQNNDNEPLSLLQKNSFFIRNLPYQEQLKEKANPNEAIIETQSSQISNSFIH